MKLLERLLGSGRGKESAQVRELPRKVRKAVFPVAGLGTRFLPATKAMPKEMLPIVDRPLIQYAVDEAVAAGIRELIFVTHRSKRAIEDYFDRALEIERELASKGRHEQLNELRRLVPEQVHIAYARQSAPLGLGHAIQCARHLIGNEPFAVVLPDDLIDAEQPVLSQMVERYNSCGSSVVAVQTVPREETSQYGIVEIGDAPPARVLGIVEKPQPQVAPSDQAVVGRYIFTPRILDCLDGLEPGANNEIQLTDGIARLLGREPVFAHRFTGTRYDCGSKLGFLEATLAYASKHDELGTDFRALLTATARRLNTSDAPNSGAAHLTLVSG
jgi:UTP--glucose-1-phosphate uridylyltransferase